MIVLERELKLVLLHYFIFSTALQFWGRKQSCQGGTFAQMRSKSDGGMNMGRFHRTLKCQTEKQTCVTEI